MRFAPLPPPLLMASIVCIAFVMRRDTRWAKEAISEPLTAKMIVPNDSIPFDLLTGAGEFRSRSLLLN